MSEATVERLGLRRQGDGRVSNIELFYDLVYVFAVTQLSHLLVAHPTADGAVQTAVLMAMVWQVWVYTTWAINYLDPTRYAVRAVLLLLMFGSLTLAAALPEAFTDRGMVVAVAYVVMQGGREIFLVWVLRGDPLQKTFLRIFPWTALSGVVMIGGAVEHGHVRELLWAASIAIDLIAAGFGFYVPGLGRSATTEWTINGAHFAERCQAFVLIALGESIVVIGGLADLRHPTAARLAGFAVAFAGAVVLWWIYFDRAAEDSTESIESSEDPGRLARSAFHWIHPLIVGGIIVTAAADERVLDDPTGRGEWPTAWLALGGVALFLAGHAAFKAVVWRTVSWPRVIGVAVLLAALPIGRHVSALALGIGVLAVAVAVAIADRILHPAAA